ncbi:hypothetical protein ACFP3Q_09075 [Nocardioides sp. GCM10027113]|uniref:hypothetical protein n=1 Tax=unclassified Nocardioides TaxID=2615069 RepID=UPI003621C9ED
MPTAASSTERHRGGTGLLSPAGWRASCADVGHVLRFRAQTVRRGASLWAAVSLLLVTAAIALVPAFVGDAGEGPGAVEVAILLPTGFAAFLLIAIVSAVVSGGGRELLPRDQAAIHPLSPTSDHLGALLLAPLNIAWLLQAWALLGSAAYGLGPDTLHTMIPVILLWLAAATAAAQVVAWAVEAVRRMHGGVVVVRLLGITVAVVALWLHVSGRLTSVLDSLPTVWFVVGGVEGVTWRFAATLAAEAGIFVVAVLVGALPAHLAARRTARDEVRLDSAAREPLPMPRGDLLALVRTDRASVWRTVPVRRGMAVLAVGPGLVALAGNLQWATMTVLPGLVASGGALLFGVNVWCLDGRGGLWRESQPVEPGPVFAARAWVLAEFLLLASAITIALASLRAGIPSSAELTALLCTLVVVTIQVVGAAMRWSMQRPFAADLRSARATPAPPVVMVGYSARLALSTTLTGLVFSGLARVPVWEASVLIAIPFVGWSLTRLARTRARWLDPVQRARVVASVAA